jgi:hypothetical protein
MLLYKVEITSQKSVDDFGSVSALRLVLFAIGEAIVKTKLLVGFILAQHLTSHLEGIPNLHTPREEVAILGGGQKSLSVVERAIVEAGIVGDNVANAILLDYITQDRANGFEPAKLTLARLDFVPILGNFLGEVGRSHQLIVEEDISYYIAVRFIDCASSIHNCKAHIIAKGIIDRIGGFGVDYKELGFGVHIHYLFHLMNSL